MKILLMQPPIQDFYDTKIRLMPLGLAYIKASILKGFPHYNVLIEDYHSGYPKKSIQIPDGLKYLREYYVDKDKGPFSTFNHYYHFGESYSNIVNETKQYSPDLIGISSLFSPYYKEVLTITKQLKKHLPNTPIILGGAHVSACPEMMLKNDSIDYIIVGEGEKPIVEFLKQLNQNRDFKKVSGLGYKKGEKIYINDRSDNYPISEIPFPNLKDFNPNVYLFEKRPITFLIGSRSCPYKCNFCSVHTTFGNNFRQRAVKNIISEMNLRYNEGFRVFDFEDDNLTINKSRILSLCNEIEQQFSSKKIQITAMNGISYQHLDSDILNALKKTGLQNLNIALVSNNETLIAKSKRPHNLEQFKRIALQAFNTGLKVTTYQIIGHPKESLQSMYNTTKFLTELPVLLGASIFYLTPNSPIAKENPNLQEMDIVQSRLTAMAIETDNFNRDDIFTLFICIRIINFLKGIIFNEETIDFVTLLNSPLNIKNRESVGKYILKKLLSEKKLLQLNGNSFQKVEKFNYPAFQTLFKHLTKIKTLNNKTIIIDCF